MEDNPKIDNRVCLFYVADRLMEITEISDRRQMEIAIDEFKNECLRNLGVNALHDHNNQKGDKMRAYDLIKLLDITFPDVQMDIYDWEEGIVKVIFTVDKEEDE